MGERHARIFDSMRAEVLARLVEVRGSIDHSYEKISSEVITEHFDIILDKVRKFLALGDASSYRRFATRYLAIRVAEGVSHESLIHAIVAIGDVVAQVARASLEPSPERERFVREVMRMNFVHARMMVAFFADELAERTAQHALLLESVR